MSKIDFADVAYKYMLHTKLVFLHSVIYEHFKYDLCHILDFVSVAKRKNYYFSGYLDTSEISRYLKSA